MSPDKGNFIAPDDHTKITNSFDAFRTDYPHPLDRVVQERAELCAECPGKEIVLRGLMTGIMEAERNKQTPDPKAEAQVIWCLPCGVAEKPRVEIRSA